MDGAGSGLAGPAAAMRRTAFARRAVGSAVTGPGRPVLGLTLRPCQPALCPPWRWRCRPSAKAPGAPSSVWPWRWIRPGRGAICGSRAGSRRCRRRCRGKVAFRAGVSSSSGKARRATRSRALPRPLACPSACCRELVLRGRQRAGAAALAGWRSMAPAAATVPAQWPGQSAGL